MGFSRQRYWGCPIPIAYDETEKFILYPNHATVKLPQNINLNVKGNPLDNQSEWKEIEINGKKLLRN